MAPFLNYHPGSQHLTLRIKDGRKSEVAGGRSNRARQHRRSKAGEGFMCTSKEPPVFVWMRSRFAAAPKGLGTKSQDGDEVQMTNLGVNKLHSCMLEIIIRPDSPHVAPVIVFLTRNI